MLTRSVNCLGSEVVISLSVLTSLWLVGAAYLLEWSQRSINIFTFFEPKVLTFRLTGHLDGLLKW